MEQWSPPLGDEVEPLCSSCGETTAIVCSGRQSGLHLHCDLLSICVTIYALHPREEHRKQDRVLQSHPGALSLLAIEVLG